MILQFQAFLKNVTSLSIE